MLNFISGDVADPTKLIQAPRVATFEVTSGPHNHYPGSKVVVLTDKGRETSYRRQIHCCSCGSSWRSGVTTPDSHFPEEGDATLKALLNWLDAKEEHKCLELVLSQGKTETILLFPLG